MSFSEFSNTVAAEALHDQCHTHHGMVQEQRSGSGNSECCPLPALFLFGLNTMLIAGFGIILQNHHA